MSTFNPALGVSGTDIPGTVYLIDLEHIGRDTQHAGHKDIILVPQPILDNKRDPLNWPRYKKYWSLFLASLYACIVAFSANILGAAWTTVAEDSHTSLNQMNGASAMWYILVGFANLLWVPTAMKVGRKFCYIAAMTIDVASMIWNAYFMGAGQWYGDNFLSGIGVAAYEAIIQLTIFDMFFAHERGTMLAVYVWTMSLGAILGLILGGYISDDIGWRAGCKISAILGGVVVLLFILTFDDSLFPRHVFRDGVTNVIVTETRTDSEPTDTEGKHAADKTSEPITRQISTSVGPVEVPPRSYLEVLNPIHFFAIDQTRWIQYFLRPFELFLFPNIAIAGIIFAFGATGGVVTFNTISEIMTEPPYSWTDGPTGLMYLSSLVGSIIGMFTANMGDRIVLFLARRNGGYKEPEMRLWILAVTFVYAGVGLFAYGWGAETGAPWAVIAIGLGAVNAHQVTASSVATAYAMECYEGIAGELVVVLACCSAVVNCAMSEAVQPFIADAGYGWTFTFFGLCVLLSVGLALPLGIWGKSWRKRGKARYERFISQGVGIGMG